MKGYKTLVYVALSLLAVLGVPEIQDLIAQHPTVSTIVNGIVVAGLRFVTTSPIFKS